MIYQIFFTQFVYFILKNFINHHQIDNFITVIILITVIIVYFYLINFIKFIFFI